MRLAISRSTGRWSRQWEGAGWAQVRVGGGFETGGGPWRAALSPWALAPRVSRGHHAEVAALAPQHTVQTGSEHQSPLESRAALRARRSSITCGSHEGMGGYPESTSAFWAPHVAQLLLSDSCTILRKRLRAASLWSWRRAMHLKCILVLTRARTRYPRQMPQKQAATPLGIALWGGQVRDEGLAANASGSIRDQKCLYQF